MLPRLYGLPWDVEPVPWAGTSEAAIAFVKCFTEKLFYSNLAAELFTVIELMRSFKKNFVNLTLKDKNAINCVNEYLVFYFCW